MLKDTAIIITTFLREKTLEKCLRFIREFYPDIRIFVSSSGYESESLNMLCNELECELIRVPFDSGVCRARNEAMDRMPEDVKYVLILEDDIVFTRKSKIERMREILVKRKTIGIVGCKFERENGDSQEYEGNLTLDKDNVYVRKALKKEWSHVGNTQYIYCDIVINVFMMRKEIWDTIRWDENFKTTPEHTDFFLMVKQNSNWKVVYTDSVTLEHHSSRDTKYFTYRARLDGYLVLAEKWGIKYYWNDWNESWGLENPIGLYTMKQAGEKRSEVEIKGSEIGIMIKTFLRDSKLIKTLDAIRSNVGHSYRLYIADDGGVSNEKEWQYQELEKQGHKILRMPFDSGLSSGRNAILKKIKEPLVLVMDDDILIGGDDPLLKMKKILFSDQDIGICAGTIYEEQGEPFGGKSYSNGLRLEIDRGVLFRRSNIKNIIKTDGVFYWEADQVVNFFLAKREVFDDIQWDSRIKIGLEHMDFFLRLKQTRWKAVVCPDAKAIHQRGIADSEYNEYRRKYPQTYFYGKHGIGNIINQYQRG